MKNRIATRFTHEYGVEHPIALAPMAFIGTAPHLAIAVCKAGGVGSLAAGPLPAEVLRGLIKKAAYGSNYQRLVALKNKYDPTNLFRHNQNIKSTV